MTTTLVSMGFSVCLFLPLCMAPSALGRDCNGNGVEDTEDIARGDSLDCNGNKIPDACEGWPIRFSAGREWELARPPEDLAAGDIDNDGAVDLLIAQASVAGSSLRVFRNSGLDRSFQAGEEIPLTGTLTSIALADLDGDGWLDVIGVTGDEIVTLANVGDGSFAAPVRYGAFAGTDYVHAADVTGDGAVDLLAVNRGSDTISLWVNGNQGDGRMLDSVAVAIGGRDPIAIGTGDLDRDGDLDLVSANRESADFSILRNRGDGTFEEPRAYARGATVMDPQSLAVADFNGDGLLDLGSTKAVSHSFLFNRGDAVFSEPVNFKTKSIFSALRALNTADFDHDGDLDLVGTSSREGVSIRQNDGEGGFAQNWELGYGPPTVAIAVADFDGDGWADLALASASPNAVAFVWNEGGESALDVGIEVEVLPLEGCSDDRGCRPHGGAIADLDGDGDFDGIGLMTHPGEFHFVDNENGILVTRPEPYTFGRAGQTNGEHGQWVAPGDVDGDGDLDLVSIDNHSNDFWVHLNRGDGSFEPVGKDRRIRVGDAPQHVVLGDLDGDGDLDGVTSNLGDGSISIVTGRGDGTFDPSSRRIRTGSGTRGTALGDLNGDGLPDIVAANSTAESITLLINRGDGNFPSQGESVPLAGNPNGVTLADFDGDGQVDIAAAQGDSENCAILLNTGDGSFAAPQYYPVDEAGVYSVSAVDFNLDGVLDLVTANEIAGSVSLLLGNGDGSFRAATSYSAGAGAGNRMALPGDLDGDGDPDILTFNRGNGTATVLYNRSAFDHPDYADTICTVAEFFQLAAEAANAGAEGGQEFVKFILPSSDAAALEATLFQNSRRYRLHQDFLTKVFPQSFPALDSATYDSLVGRRDSRHYFVGAIRVIRTAKGAQYAFDVFARFGDSKERLSAAELGEIYAQLQESFRLGPLVYAPTSLEAVELARDWQKEGLDFPILIEGSTGGFEPYTEGVGYGRVRILSPEAFAQANASGGISFQDILILERAPRDIEGVVNGIITAERQGELSHLAVRTARRGTPNAFVRSALADFSDFEGELVRLQVSQTGYAVREVTQSEAEAFWEANAGFLSRQPSLDADFAELATLEDIAQMDLANPAGELPIEARFGGKASNLARLRAILTGDWSRYQMNGFAVPMAHYLHFIRTNSLPSAFAPEREVSYEVYLQELFASEEFTTNSRFRFEVLATLREHMRDFGAVDENLLAALRDRIGAVMGTPPEIRVRFRSSSNAEDAIEFNGAGLYDSTQGCVADDLDDDSSGPSHCNEDKNGERDLARALRRVWSSLWNFRAFEERAFYRILSDLPAMGVLVSEAFDAELANGVATTGNATNRLDPRFVITVQKDDQSVVSPAPGILPEKNVLEMGEDGEVSAIIRAVASSLVEPGEFVLSDAELRELGRLLWHIHKEFPVDSGEHERDDLLLEIEFKKRADGRLAVKQVRPFLLTERGALPPVFSLSIPEPTVLCAKFDAPNLSRSVMDEVALKAQLHLRGGLVMLPTAIDRFSGELVEKLVFGQDRRVALPQGPGTFRVETLPGEEPGVLIYRFDYAQSLEFPDGEIVEVKWALLDFQTLDGVRVRPTLSLDETYLVEQLSLQTQLEHRGETVTNFYGSCRLETLPLWEIRAELDDGSTLVLEERSRDGSLGDFAPAGLVAASVEIAGQHRTVSDYWDLIYKAARHNEHVEYLLKLDTPVDLPGVNRPVHAIQLLAPSHGDPPKGLYLDASLEEIAQLAVTGFERVSAQGRVPVRPAIDCRITLQWLAVNGLTERYPILTFSDRAGTHAHAHPRVVESSLDLMHWEADAVRVSVEDHGDGRVTETWRGAAPVAARSVVYWRLREN